MRLNLERQTLKQRGGLVVFKVREKLKSFQLCATTQAVGGMYDFFTDHKGSSLQCQSNSSMDAMPRHALTSCHAFGWFSVECWTSTHIGPSLYDASTHDQSLQC
eukprot:997135-Amphidinium_carterae.1